MVLRLEMEMADHFCHDFKSNIVIDRNRYNTLQHTATHGNTFQHTTATHSTLFHDFKSNTATHCNTRKYTTITQLFHSIQDKSVQVSSRGLSPAPWLTQVHTNTHTLSLSFCPSHTHWHIRYHLLLPPDKNNLTQTHIHALSRSLPLTHSDIYSITYLWNPGVFGGKHALPVVLHVTATHCNTLQHTATHCNTLQ